MSKKNFRPFKNEADSVEIGDLTIENRVDRVSIFGSIDITKDKIGLSAALELKSILDEVLSELQSADLPEKIEIKAPETVPNPFA